MKRILVLNFGNSAKQGNDDEPFWSSDLQIAMLDQARPIYLFQPKNGRYLNPTKILFGIAVDQEYPSQAAIFPASPCNNQINVDPIPPCDTSQDPEFKQAHGNFIGRDSEVAKWGPSVVEFMKRYPRN